MRCTVTGPVVLPDAPIEGPLRLIDTRPGTADGPALNGGALDCCRERSMAR
ncbi:MAG: hypothetical protein ACRDRP_06715 [Pseudonocardiaceae bacterium]